MFLLSPLRKVAQRLKIAGPKEREWLYAELFHCQRERELLRQELSVFKTTPMYVLPGHFYSPIPCIDEVAKDEARIFGRFSKDFPGVELNEADQLRLLHDFVPFYREMPFQAYKTEGLRYYFENPAYSYSDGVFLHCMIRHLKPKRVIEVGSGYSSCVTLDTNELFLNNSIATTFIEPYPELLLSLIREEDKPRMRIVQSRLQDVDLKEFEALEANDILFIDSTHVSRVFSDVNCVFFEILPRLASGVHIHFHDIFYPFEYPKDWHYQGRAWTELYMLRAFLQYNHAFRVVLMNTFMEHFHEPFFKQEMPLCLRNRGGSIWIRKV